MNTPPKIFDAQVLEQIDSKTYLPLNLYESAVSAGFPSPSTDHLEGKLDLNEYMIKNPPATFFVRVSGDSMIGAGIHPDDVLVVDRSEEPRSGKIVIAVINGELTVKRLQKNREGVQLLPENPEYAPIVITSDMEFQVWGVVTFVIHKP